MERVVFVGKPPPLPPARRNLRMPRARSWPEAALASLPVRLPPLIAPSLRSQVPVEAALPRPVWRQRWRPIGSIKVRPPSSRALHAARASPEAAKTTHARLFAHPACPSLALDPTPLSAFVRLLAQDQDDIYGEHGTWLRLWMGNQPLGLWWGSHAFELIYRAI